MNETVIREAPLGLNQERSEEEFWVWMFPDGESLCTSGISLFRYVSPTAKGVTRLAKEWFGEVTVCGEPVTNGYPERLSCEELWRGVEGLCLVDDYGQEIARRYCR